MVKNDEKWGEKLSHLCVLCWAMLFCCPVLGGTLLEEWKWTKNILPSTGQENNITQPQKQISGSFFFKIVFNRLTVVQVLFCSSTKGTTPNSLLVLSCLSKNSVLLNLFFLVLSVKACKLQALREELGGTVLSVRYYFAGWLVSGEKLQRSWHRQTSTGRCGLAAIRKWALF